MAQLLGAMEKERCPLELSGPLSPGAKVSIGFS